MMDGICRKSDTFVLFMNGGKFKCNGYVLEREEMETAVSLKYTEQIMVEGKKHKERLPASQPSVVTSSTHGYRVYGLGGMIKMNTWEKLKGTQGLH